MKRSSIRVNIKWVIKAKIYRGSEGRRRGFIQAFCCEYIKSFTYLIKSLVENSQISLVFYLKFIYMVKWWFDFMELFEYESLCAVNLMKNY